MMKKVVVLTALLISYFAVGVMAAEGPYASASLGATMPLDSDIRGGGESGKLTYRTGIAYSAAVGYNFGMARIEGEFGYKNANIDEVKIDGIGSTPMNGDFSTTSYMANGYIDCNVNPTLKPFLMAGVGMAKVTYDSNDLDDSDSGFAYQFGTGVGIVLNDKTTFDISYRYMSTQDPYIDGVITEYGSHNFLAGVRVQF